MASITFGTADGGGMRCEPDDFAPPSVSLVEVYFRNNVADSQRGGLGGGLLSRGCNLMLTQVTFDGNTASLAGGGLSFSDVFGSTTVLSLTNVTFFGNSAGDSVPLCDVGAFEAPSPEDVVFTDGFESGDTFAWSETVH